MKRIKISIGAIRIDATGIPHSVPILIIILIAVGIVARLRGWI